MTELEAISPHSTELTLKLSIAPSDVGHTLGLSQTSLFVLFTLHKDNILLHKQPTPSSVHTWNLRSSVNTRIHAWVDCETAGLFPVAVY